MQQYRKYIKELGQSKSNSRSKSPPKNEPIKIVDLKDQKIEETKNENVNPTNSNSNIAFNT